MPCAAFRGCGCWTQRPDLVGRAQASLGSSCSTRPPQGLLGHMGEALVELDGTGRLFGAPRDTAARMQRELAQATGWTSQGGLSRSATAAKLATRLEFRAAIGLEEVPEGGEPVFLAPQPLARMPDLAPRLRWRFQRLGLHRFGDLQPVPLPTLAQLMPEDQARPC